jgi:hypothetical protein
VALPLLVLLFPSDNMYGQLHSGVPEIDGGSWLPKRSTGKANKYVRDVFLLPHGAVGSG